MFSLFLLAFIMCLVYNYLDDGGNFAFFSRVVEMANSVREPTPRAVRSNGSVLLHELKFGKRLYGMLIPKKVPLKWTTAAALVNDVWKDVTTEMEYWAGPYKDFYGIPVKPQHINESYDKLGFAFSHGVIHVERQQIIILHLRAQPKAPSVET